MPFTVDRLETSSPFCARTSVSGVLPSDTFPPPAFFLSCLPSSAFPLGHFFSLSSVLSELPSSPFAFPLGRLFSLNRLPSSLFVFPLGRFVYLPLFPRPPWAASSFSPLRDSSSTSLVPLFPLSCGHRYPGRTGIVIYSFLHSPNSAPMKTSRPVLPLVGTLFPSSRLESTSGVICAIRVSCSVTDHALLFFSGYWRGKGVQGLLIARQ